MNTITTFATPLILDFLHQNNVLRERITKSSPEFDRLLSQHLQEPKYKNGIYKKNISYYDTIRTKFPTNHKNNIIEVETDFARITIYREPSLHCFMRIKKENLQHLISYYENDDIVDIILNKLSLPVDVDKVCMTLDKNDVVLTFYYCHYDNLHYDNYKGYFIIPKTHSALLWEYKLCGPAQIYQEMTTLCDFLRK